MTGTIATGSDYIGRFAPSPTGPLHFGSLLAAVASFLQARANGGSWFLRIEDVDPPREQPGADTAIIAALDAYGFEWDGPVIWQSSAEADQDAAVAYLRDKHLAYPCSCSRRDLADAPRSPLGIVYPGTCRQGCDADEFAIRVRTNNDEIGFNDGLQGAQSQRLESESGDFVIRRRDGLIAYHLAVVVSDHLEGITEIVRGIDLVDSTPRQIWLQRLLGYATPSYMHIPVATHPDGQKLSKLTGAKGLPLKGKRRILLAALAALRQEPPGELASASLSDIWDWSVANWRHNVLQSVTAIPSNSDAMATLKNGLW
ncbi:MAG: tRNA glutamyl-Q(34) synthetase GluQRS [Woeseiaceae bacterium]|nr:tRNA glutamyl-Q(34) synthetase GluQRS [Woeseiaceae bacterium]